VPRKEFVEETVKTPRELIANLPIDEVRIGARHRKDIGDLENLAVSIEEKGVLQPIGITPDRELVFGLRRLMACRDRLGWRTIPARIIPVTSIAQGEFAENMVRKDFAPSERVAIVDTLRGYKHGGDRKSNQLRNCDIDRHSVSHAASLVGDTKDNYYRAKKVVERGVPELIAAMDSGRLSVYAASLIADAAPEDQRRVLEKGGKEEVWTAKGIRKQLRRVQKERDREDARQQEIAVPDARDPIRIYNCPFQSLTEVAGITPSSVPLICTDIPYGEEFLGQLDELARLAAELLIEGGLFVTYYGHYYVNSAMKILDQHLTYAWMRCSRWVGAGNICFTRQVTSKWKPILVYSKGDWVERERWYDYTFHEEKEKDWHDWQQPLEEVKQIIRDFSNPGDLVVDPCGGGFTTAIACHQLNRLCVSCDIDAAYVVRGQERLALCRAEGRDVPNPRLRS
jgi:hypothetical protein